MWLGNLGRLVTAHLLCSRNILDSGLCPRCVSEEETVVHTLRDCPEARKVWELCISPTQFLAFMSIPSDDWLKVNTTSANLGLGAGIEESQEKGFGPCCGALRRPHDGWFKLNTMRAFILIPRRLPEEDYCEMIMEMLALREGLKLAWERRVPRLEAEIDSEVVYDLVRSRATSDHPLHVILEDVRDYTELPWELRRFKL
ncbi:hypothetical protein OROHE_019481 [Orobanche hederae]